MRYVLYLSGLRPIDEYRRAFVPIFEDIALAKAFIITFMANEPIIPDGNLLTWGPEYRLKTSHLTEILEAPDVELPEFYARQILQFKYGHWEPKPASPKPDATGGTTSAPSSVRVTRAARPAGYVTITELATTWGIPALHARAALRASDRVKPEYGWAFAPEEVPVIKKLVGVPS